MAIVYNTSIVRSGLVLHLDAANSKSYPSTGTAWTDLSGNSNNGTLTDGPTFDSSNGGSIVFDGINDFIETNKLGIVPASTNFTVSVWLNVPLNPTKVHGAIWSQDAGGMFYAYTTFGTAAGRVRFNGIGISEILVGTDIRGIGWTNLVLQREGSTFRLYRNANIEASATNAGSVNVNSTFKIGREHSTLDRVFNGRISNFKVYNRALTAAEIAQNFEAIRGRYGI